MAKSKREYRKGRISVKMGFGQQSPAQGVK
jgi:hypothetical protein